MCGHGDIRNLNSNRIGRIRPELLANSLLAEDIAFDEVDGDDYLVFVYETLMNRKLRKALLQREVKFDIDEIEGYKEYAVETIEGDNYHTIISSEDDRVRGHVMHLTRDEMAVVDAWEDQYKRIQVKTKNGRNVFVYVLRISNIRDHGQNINVELSDDDIAMLQAAKDTGEYILGKKGEESMKREESLKQLRATNKKLTEWAWKIGKSLKEEAGLPEEKLIRSELQTVFKALSDAQIEAGLDGGKVDEDVAEMVLNYLQKRSDTALSVKAFRLLSKQYPEHEDQIDFMMQNKKQWAK